MIDKVIKLIELASTTEAYLAVSIFFLIVVVFYFHMDPDFHFYEEGIGYTLFWIVLLVFSSLLWPVTLMVFLLAYTVFSIGAIKDKLEKYKDLNNKLCGTIDY
jgi:hypothetical protein